MLTKSAVLDRDGWSKSILDELLGEPDLRKKQFGRSNPVFLYQLDRVTCAEATDLFLAKQDALARRKQAAQKAVKTKTKNLLQEVSRMTVAVKKVKNVEALAIVAYNDRNWEARDLASIDSDKDFLDRICVNYIRHELTEYDASLEVVAGKTGSSKAVSAIRDKIYASIAERYPKYADECDKQKRLREDLSLMRDLYNEISTTNSRSSQFSVLDDAC